MGKRAAVKEEAVKRAGMNLDVGDEIARGTNILEIKVPEQLDQSVISGLDFFDSMLGGDGMTPSQSILLTGGPGAGKTTLALQIADAITERGGIALYNTNEEAAVQVRKTVRRLNLRSGFIIGQDRLVPKTLEHMDYVSNMPQFKGKKIPRVLIEDSLQTMDDGFYPNGGTNSNTPVRVTELATKWAKKNFDIIILIGQVNKDGEFNGKNVIKHAVDTHLHIYIDKAKKSETYGERIFESQKNRFGCSGLQFIVGMDKDKGLYLKLVL